MTITAADLQTVRALLIEFEADARRNGHELRRPWSFIRDLLKEREEMREDNICLGILAEKYLEIVKDEPTVSLEEIMKKYGI